MSITPPSKAYGDGGVAKGRRPEEKVSQPVPPTRQPTPNGVVKRRILYAASRVYNYETVRYEEEFEIDGDMSPEAVSALRVSMISRVDRVVDAALAKMKGEV